jgi:hypothetical protein
MLRKRRLSWDKRKQSVLSLLLLLDSIPSSGDGGDDFHEDEKRSDTDRE